MEQAASKLRQLIMSFRITQLIYVAAKLNIADQLSDKPKSSQELAEQVGAEPDALYRTLRALASVGLFVETDNRSFALTPMGGLLKSDVPGSMRQVALLYGEDWLWQAYGRMLFSVQTGQPAFPEANGLSYYEFLEQHPAAASVFQAAMSSFSNHEAAAVLAAYEFGDVKTVVDVGAGHGALLAAALQAHPQLSGVAFDLPAAGPGADRTFADARLTGRAQFSGGDFFTKITPGCDLYMLKSVLHNWDDDAVRRVLQACRRAMSAHSRLLIIERVVPEGNDESEAKLFDINMLVIVGGQERTQREYEALLADAGFALSRVVPTSSPLTLLEAVPRAQ